ncbi:hypothetical protein GCM10022279_06870 [Comamonas faecalis]|uniref:Chitin-binding type-2 domain-containing protein n=1 Tax=Comamonas faecalis TaxID=1387849 RepID=A0ABP7QQM8_9BURK
MRCAEAAPGAGPAPAGPGATMAAFVHCGVRVPLDAGMPADGFAPTQPLERTGADAPTRPMPPEALLEEGGSSSFGAEAGQEEGGAQPPGKATGRARAVAVAAGLALLLAAYAWMQGSDEVAADAPQPDAAAPVAQPAPQEDLGVVPAHAEMERVEISQEPKALKEVAGPPAAPRVEQPPAFWAIRDGAAAPASSAEPGPGPETEHAPEVTPGPTPARTEAPAVAAAPAAVSRAPAAVVPAPAARVHTAPPVAHAEPAKVTTCDGASLLMRPVCFIEGPATFWKCVPDGKRWDNDIPGCRRGQG